MPGAPVSPKPAVFALFSLDNIEEAPAAPFTGWLNSHCKNNHIGPRSRRLFYLAMIPIVPQRTHGATTRDDPEPQRRQAGLAMAPIFTEDIQHLGTATAPGVSPPVPAISLKNDVQTMAYPAGGATAFILLSLLKMPSSFLRGTHPPESASGACAPRACSCAAHHHLRRSRSAATSP
jgi:hypothetical protein